MTASGLSYTPDDIEAFVTYIYAEYWADDLVNDEFVPETCINNHFSADISWVYGGSTPSPRIPLVGEYKGHAGMSKFLGDYGKAFQVLKWDATKLAFSKMDDEGSITCFVALDATYKVRSNEEEFNLRELHELTVKKEPESGEPQICSVRILFDHVAVETALGK